MSTAAPRSRVAIIIVTYQGRMHIERCLRSCLRAAPAAEVIVADNASSDGTAALVRTGFPSVRLITLAENRGFGAGCNAGMESALERGAAHLLLLNQDAELTDGAVDALSEFLETHPSAGAVQPAIMRPDGLVNTLGNPLHFLGFSAAGGNGYSLDGAVAALPWLRHADWLRGAEVPACSGACMMLRADAVRDAGGFEELLFLYHEDLELCMRLRARGWTLWVLGAARVIHHYEFSRNPSKMYYMERNRIWLLCSHLRKRTLAVLLMPLLASEAAIWLVAITHGWAGEKLRSYTYWTHPGRLRSLRQRRATLQRRRRCSDRTLLAPATARLAFADVDALRATRLVTPLAEWVWRLLYALIRW